MWSICTICGAVIADEALHYAWHYPPAPDQTPAPTPGTDLIPYPETEPF